jgi:uncharacterized membrane protein YcjF (UPF0283 family)
MKTLRKILILAATGFTILAVIGLAGSAMVLYREAAAVHEVLGWLVISLLACGVALFVIYPIARLLMLPRSLLRPDRAAGSKWEKYLKRYAGRLLKSSAVRDAYERASDLRAAYDASRGGKKPRGAAAEAGEAVAPALRISHLEDEIAKTLRFLDERARQIICRHAAAVFATTAVSQSGRLDTAIVISAQLRLVKEIAEVYYQRPNPRELLRLYLNVGASAFIAGEIQDSEVLAVLGAPVSAGLSGLIPISGTDPLVSLLMSSFLDGSANALLTLRVGVLARRYCGIRLEEDRRRIARSASLEAAGLLGGVVAAGARRVAAATQRLVLGSAVKIPQRAAMGVVGAGSDLLSGISKLAGKAAGTATKKISESHASAMKQMLRFWEYIEAVFDPKQQNELNPAEEKKPGDEAF